MTTTFDNRSVPVLEASGISRAFGQNRVLRDVSFSIGGNEILALVGENGAGKSTLMNIISGGLPPDEGRLSLDGAEYAPTSPLEAMRRGVAIAHQETAIIPDLTVAENIFFGREPRGPLGLIRQRALHRSCAGLLDDLGFSVSPKRLGSDLSAAELQMVEIARAMSLEPRVLVLDEPTASLSSKAAKTVIDLMQRLKARGTSIVFISHRLGEVMDAADRAIVLKDGALTLDKPAGDFSRDDLIQAMVGRKLSNIFPERPSSFDAGPPAIRLQDAGNASLPPVSLSVRKGEVLGVAGLEGQGQHELAAALSGARPFRSGTVEIDGKPTNISSVARAIALGVASIPDDRKRDGLALTLPVRTNMSLFAIGRDAPFGLLPLATEKRFTEEARDRFAIKAASLEQPVGELSGGNQQKVVFARWLAHTPKILLLAEPTKGVDIETKSEIYRLVSELTGKGVAVILISSDLLELIGLSDRIMTVYERRISAEIARADFSEEHIMRCATRHADEPAEVVHA